MTPLLRCDATLTLVGQSPLPCGLLAGHAGDHEFGLGQHDTPKTAPDIEAAALHAADRRGHTGSARYIYASGWAQGYAEILSETTTSLEAIAAGGYTPAQEARAAAIAAASRMLAGSPIGWGLRGVDRALDIGRTLATWIEHGDPAPATLVEHIESAMDLVGSARAVVADALNDIRGDPDLGDRVDQELAAAKQAQPRVRPQT